jgi:dihydrofolate synthase/folylpolyglutamate synthase
MRFETLQQWLDWQLSLHPREIELGLERVAKVWSQMHQGAFPCPVITVAGTNGKGSSVAFLESILQAAGYRVGCYTSPHILRYNERIRIDGRELDDASICQSFERVDQAREDTALTFFEFGTLAALDCFSNASLDVVILEVGLGGRLDAVNILDADAVLITGVDLDHMDWLGDDLESIGREKAGVMRSSRPAVYAAPNPPVSVVEHAQSIGATLYRAGESFGHKAGEQGWEWWSETRKRHSLPLPGMRGSFQLANAAGVLMVLESLQNILPVDQRAIRVGLQDARLPGRFEIVQRDPLVIVDVAHNAQAARVLGVNLKDMFCPGESVAVLAMLGDKDATAVVTEVMGQFERWFLAPLDMPRGSGVEALAEHVARAGVDVSSMDFSPSVSQALGKAMERAGESGRVVVFGSFHTVAEALESLA